MADARKLEIQARAIIEEFLSRIGYSQPILDITITQLPEGELARIYTNWPYNNSVLQLSQQPTTQLPTTLLHECCHLLLAPLAEGGDKEEMVASAMETAFMRLLPKGWWKAAVRRANRCYEEQRMGGQSSPPKAKTLVDRTKQRKRRSRGSVK